MHDSTIWCYEARIMLTMFRQRAAIMAALNLRGSLVESLAPPQCKCVTQHRGIVAAQPHMQRSPPSCPYTCFGLAVDNNDSTVAGHSGRQRCYIVNVRRDMMIAGTVTPEAMFNPSIISRSGEIFCLFQCSSQACTTCLMPVWPAGANFRWPGRPCKVCIRCVQEGCA